MKLYPMVTQLLFILCVMKTMQDKPCSGSGKKVTGRWCTPANCLKPVLSGAWELASSKRWRMREMLLITCRIPLMKITLSKEYNNK